MTTIRKGALLFIVFLLTFTCYSAGEVVAPLEVAAKVDKAIVKSDEEFVYTLTIKALPTLKFQTSEFASALQGARLIATDDVKPKAEDGKIIYQKWYKMKADISGSYIMPEVTVVYEDPTTKIQKSIKTSEIFVEVQDSSKTIVAGGNATGASVTKLRDIKPLLKKPWGIAWWHVALILLSSVLLGWGGYLIYKRFYRKADGAVIIIPPATKAWDHLTALDQEENYSTAREKYFHFTLSEIIRTYVEEQFAFHATDMTIEEIKKQLDDLHGVERELKQEFLQILSSCDLIKFTDMVSSMERSRQLIIKTKDFVTKTKPQETLQEESVI